MRHAFILEENRLISRAIEHRLVEMGFASFDHAWTENQAIEAARMRSPDLVVVGDTIAGGSPLASAKRLSDGWDVPILLITADRCRIERQLPKGATLSRRFPLNEIDASVALATSPEPRWILRGSAKGTEPLGQGDYR